MCVCVCVCARALASLISVRLQHLQQNCSNYGVIITSLVRNVVALRLNYFIDKIRTAQTTVCECVCVCTACVCEGESMREEYVLSVQKFCGKNVEISCFICLVSIVVGFG